MQMAQSCGQPGIAAPLRKLAADYLEAANSTIVPTQGAQQQQQI